MCASYCGCDIETCVTLQGFLALVFGFVVIIQNALVHPRDVIHGQTEYQAAALDAIHAVSLGLFMSATILMLIGVCYRKRTFFLPYMVMLALSGTHFNADLIWMAKYDAETTIVPIVMTLIYSAIHICCLILITSLYHKYGPQERNRSTDDMTSPA